MYGYRLGYNLVQLGALLNYSLLLPLQLTVSPDLYVEEMDEIGDWISNGVLSLDTVEKISGDASLKTTSLASTKSIFLKEVAWDLSECQGSSLRLWIYPHSPIDKISLIIQVSSDLAELNRFTASYPTNTLRQNEWNLLTKPFSVNLGTPDWGDIKKIRFTVADQAGEITECSFDLLSAGIVTKPSFLFTFDDAWESIYTSAFPILRANKMTATMYVCSDKVNTTGYMTSAMLQELSAEGWDIANHTKTHTNLTTLTPSEIETELETCRLFLDGLGLSKSSKHVAYPYGAYNQDVLDKMAELGYKSGRNAGWDFVTQTTVGGTGVTLYFDPFKFPYAVDAKVISGTDSITTITDIVDTVNNRRGVGCILIHDIVESAPTVNQWLISQFSELVEYVKNLEMQTISIDEYYRLNSDEITVNHK